MIRKNKIQDSKFYGTLSCIAKVAMIMATRMHTHPAKQDQHVLTICKFLFVGLHQLFYFRQVARHTPANYFLRDMYVL